MDFYLNRFNKDLLCEVPRSALEHQSVHVDSLGWLRVALLLGQISELEGKDELVNRDFFLGLSCELLKHSC